MKYEKIEAKSQRSRQLHNFNIAKVVNLLISHTRIWGDNGQMWWAFIKADLHIFELIFTTF